MTEKAKPGDWIRGPFWHGTVQVVSLQPRDGHDVVTIYSRHQNLSRTYVLTPADWEQVHRVMPADLPRFRLGVETHRLRLAQEFLDMLGGRESIQQILADRGSWVRKGNPEDERNWYTDCRSQRP